MAPLGCWEDRMRMMGAAGGCMGVCDQGITNVGAFLLLRNPVASFAVSQILFHLCLFSYIAAHLEDPKLRDNICLI